MRAIVQLTFDMTGLRQRLKKLPRSKMEEQYKISADHVRQFEQDTWQEVSRVELLTLFALERSVRRTDKDFEVLVVDEHPIWKTFEIDRALVYQSKKPDGSVPPADAEAERQLQRTTQVTFRMAGESEQQQLTNLLTKENTIFIGSPKYQIRALSSPSCTCFAAVNCPASRRHPRLPCRSSFIGRTGAP